MPKPAYRPYRVRVRALDQLSASFTRVTLGSDELADLRVDGPDQRIKVVLPLAATGFGTFPCGADWYAAWRRLPDHARNPLRTYTIRRADPAARELVVDFVGHGDNGPASRWVGAARVGDDLMVIAPDGTSKETAGGYEWRPGGARTLLVAGDETAVPAASAIVEGLPHDAVGAVFLGVPTAADAHAVVAPPGVEVHWLPRDDADHGQRLRDAVSGWARAHLATAPAPGPATEAAGEAEDLWDVPAEPRDDGCYAWLAGEAGTIAALRRHLVRDLGVDRARVAFMGYWKIGRAEN